MTLLLVFVKYNLAIVPVAGLEALLSCKTIFPKTRSAVTNLIDFQIPFFMMYLRVWVHYFLCKGEKKINVLKENKGKT